MTLQGRSNEKGSNRFMMNLCMFIVDKHMLFMLFFLLLCIFSVFSYKWVKLEYNEAKYLPLSTETGRGWAVMQEQFLTYGSAQIMVDNISYEQAENVARDVQEIEGVFSVEFDDSADHYNNGAALFDVTYEYEEEDERCPLLLKKFEKYFTDYEAYIATPTKDVYMEVLNKELILITSIVVAVVVVVLLFTSMTYAEVPMLLIVFACAAMIQQGTNFMLGKIFFVCNSVSIVLQLALSVDYSVIFLHRYYEEREEHDVREACIIALSKSIPEVCGCSLTTLGGLASMLFMTIGISADFSRVLIKGIIISLLCVFLLMPGLIILFSGLMEKTKHKDFVPKISFVGQYAFKSRYIVPPIFIAAVIVCCFLCTKVPYVYDYLNIETPIQNVKQLSDKKIAENFVLHNSIAVVFPEGDFDVQRRMIDEILKDGDVDNVLGLANISVLHGHTLTEKLSPRQFSELINVDYEVAELIYTSYAVNDKDYVKAVSGIENYKVPLIDMFQFLYLEVKEGYVSVGDQLEEELDYYYRMINFAENQLKGEKYDRIVVNLALDKYDQVTYDFIERLRGITEKYYDEEEVFLVGTSILSYDLKQCFAKDRIANTIISILTVLVVLLFVFKSAGIPVLLIAVIQGCIWINFSSAAVFQDNVFYLSALFTCAIQMGANIDYAIVIASRYTKLRTTMGKRQAIIETMNRAFPTIITSGTMLAVAGVVIGRLTSECSVYSMGKYLGRGTIISIIVTMFALPQILLLGDKLIEITSFAKPSSGILPEDLYNHKNTKAGNKLLSILLVAIIGFNALSLTAFAAADDTESQVVSTGTRDKTIEHSVDVDADIKDERAALVKEEMEEIHISSVGDFKELAKNCSYDIWSVNKKVILEKDLTFEDGEAVAIPTFGGYFDGNGHKINKCNWTEGVSNCALFVTLQETGVITDLYIQGRVIPAGEQTVVAGIVANNYGVINNCTFNGVINADDYVGGIAGINQITGQISGCTTMGFVKGLHYVGGIAGENMGYISECKNDALINNTKVDAQLDIMNTLSSVIAQVKDFSAVAVGQKKIDATVTDIGGIAGISIGVIQNCFNAGSVGYEHIGYNVGGIVGRQSGYVSGCINNSKILGRKDVGGIVGQAEPFLTVDISESVAGRLNTAINKLNSQIRTVLSDTKRQANIISNRISAIQMYSTAALQDLAYLSDGTMTYANGLSAGVNDTFSRTNYILDKVSTDGGVIDHAENAADQISKAAAEIKVAVSRINMDIYMSEADKASYQAALTKLDSGATADIITGSATILTLYLNYLPKMTDEARADALRAMNEIQKAVKELRIAGDKLDSITGDLARRGAVTVPSLNEEYRRHTSSLVTNMQGMNDNFGMLNQEANTATGKIVDDLQAINDQFSVIMKLFAEAINGVNEFDLTDIYEDVSLAEADTTTDATIEECMNYGTIIADLDVGGIVGTMAIEYDLDRESDSTGIADAKMNTKYVTKCVLRGDKNYNMVTSEKNYVGGVCGLQEMGTIKGCTNYSGAKSASGEYAGGVCGRSLSYIVESNSCSVIECQRYVGGIAGDGTHIRDCYSVVDIRDAVSYFGAIAGHVADNGVVRNNFFVSDELAGLDKVSYALKAEPIRITDERLPEDLKHFTIVFVQVDEDLLDGEIIVKRISKDYGQSLKMSEFPTLPEKEGHYVVWDGDPVTLITHDMIIRGEYVKYRTVIGEDTSNNKKSFYQSEILVDGNFRQGEMVDVEREYIYDTKVFDKFSIETVNANEYEALIVNIPNDGKLVHQLRFRPLVKLEKVLGKPNLYLVSKDGTETLIEPVGENGEYQLYNVAGNHINLDVRFAEKGKMKFLHIVAIIVLAGLAILVAFIVALVKFRPTVHAALGDTRGRIADRIKCKEQIFYDDEDEIKEAKMKTLKVEAKRHNLRKVTDFVGTRLEVVDCSTNSWIMIALAVEEIFLYLVYLLRKSRDKSAVLLYGFDKSKRKLTIVMKATGEPHNEFEDFDINDLLRNRCDADTLGIAMVLIGMDSFDYAYRNGQNVFKIEKTI